MILPGDTPPSAPRSLGPKLSSLEVASADERPSIELHWFCSITSLYESAWAGFESGALDWPDLWLSTVGWSVPMTNDDDEDAENVERRRWCFRPLEIRWIVATLCIQRCHRHHGEAPRSYAIMTKHWGSFEDWALGVHQLDPTAQYSSMAFTVYESRNVLERVPRRFCSDLCPSTASTVRSWHLFLDVTQKLGVSLGKRRRCSAVLRTGFAQRLFDLCSSWPRITAFKTETMSQAKGQRLNSERGGTCSAGSRWMRRKAMKVDVTVAEIQAINMSNFGHLSEIIYSRIRYYVILKDRVRTLSI